MKKQDYFELIGIIILFLMACFSANAQQKEENEIAKEFVEMSVSYNFTSIYTNSDFIQVRNFYRINRTPSDVFFFKDRHILHYSSNNKEYHYTLTSDISISKETNSMTFYVQQSTTCEEAAIFFYGDSLIIIDFLNGSRLLCSKTPLNLDKWRDKLRTFDKIKNK
jgi:hypothetical protein